MLELGIVVLAVIGACWLFGALFVGLFKLTFGLIGLVFGGLFGVFALAVVALLVLPIVFFALLPLLLPVMCALALVWLVVHAARGRAPPPAPTGWR